MIILEIIGYILLAFISLIIVLLIFPVKYKAQGRKYEEILLNAEASCFFNAVNIKYTVSTEDGVAYLFRILGKKINIKRKTGHYKKLEDEQEEKKRKNKTKLIDFFQKSFWKQVLKSAGEVIKHIKFKRFDISGRFGFDDPYDTGMAWLIISNIPLHRGNVNIQLAPVYDEEVFEGRFYIRGRIVPIVIAFIALKLWLSKPVRNILRKEKGRKEYVKQF